jgi:transposase InsO family protein
MQVIRAAVSLIVRSAVLSAQHAGQQRLLLLRQGASLGGDASELARLRDENRQLKSENSLLRSRLRQPSRKQRYTPIQRLQILGHMAYYGIPRKRVKEHFCIARSTLYRWLHAAQRGVLGEERPGQESSRKTPAQLARLIWDIFEANPHFGRNRIAMSVWALGVFVAASTVRNILLRPKPRRAAPQVAAVRKQEQQPREIIARYPNHVRSVDRTRVWRWGIWPTWTLVAVDHYSRMVTTACPLEGPNAGWVVDALDDAFVRHGAPKHIISDQEAVFTGSAFRELLSQWNVKQRFGAVGEHASIAVTERAILTLKYEWLRRVPVIRRMDHLTGLLDDFEVYYNAYRAHMTLGGALPAVIHSGVQWSKPDKSAKMLPATVERRVFADAAITAYRLAA